MAVTHDYLSTLFYGPGNAILESGVRVSGKTTIERGTWVRLDSSLHNAALAEDVFVGFRSDLSNCIVGQGTLIASGACIGQPESEACQIGRGVWIGAGATIRPDVALGDGAVVAAGSVVSSDIPANHIVAGSPASLRAVRQAIDDGLPNFRELLKSVIERQRKAQLLMPALVRALGDNSATASVMKTLLIGEVPSASSWDVGAIALLDADLSGGHGVRLEDGVVLIGRGRRTHGLWAKGGISLGDRSVVGEGSILEGAGGIDIGVEARVGARVHILSSSHNYSRTSLPLSAAPVFIGADTCIGPDSLLVGPLNIPKGHTIPARSVVIPDHADRQQYKIFKIVEEVTE